MHAPAAPRSSFSVPKSAFKAEICAAPKCIGLLHLSFRWDENWLTGSLLTLSRSVLSLALVLGSSRSSNVPTINIGA